MEGIKITLMKCSAGYWWGDKWHKLETEFCNINGSGFQYCYAECLLFSTFTGCWKYLCSFLNV